MTASPWERPLSHRIACADCGVEMSAAERTLNPWTVDRFYAAHDDHQITETKEEQEQ